MRHLTKLAIALGFLSGVCLEKACAELIFLETWESPVASPGGSTSALPSPWDDFSISPPAQSRIVRPGVGEFSSVAPLGSPASGNQGLSLEGVNTGIYRMSGELIQSDTDYRLSAAIGNNSTVANDQFWSLQLWADTNNSGIFEGTGFDSFIGQMFGTNLAADNPSDGEWRTNVFYADFSTSPLSGLVGQELIVFLNNFDTGTSYYDNVALEAIVPEPSGSILILLVGLGMSARRRRRQLPTQPGH